MVVMVGRLLAGNGGSGRTNCDSDGGGRTNGGR